MAVALPMKTLHLRDEPLPSAHTLGLLLCLYLEANNFETWSLGLAVHHALAFGLPAHLNAILYWADRLEVSVDVMPRCKNIFVQSMGEKAAALARSSQQTALLNPVCITHGCPLHWLIFRLSFNNEGHPLLRTCPVVFGKAAAIWLRIVFLNFNFLRRSLKCLLASAYKPDRENAERWR